MILKELLAAVQERRAVVMATVIDTSHSVPRRAGSKMLIFADGSRSGTIGGGEMEARVVSEAAAVLAAGVPRRLVYSLLDPSSGDPGVCGGEVELYLEPYMPTSTVYVIGAGHVGLAVADLASWLGKRVVVWDDRGDLLDQLPAEVTDRSDVEVVSGDIAAALTAVPVDDHTRVVMVTRNVALDTQILPALLGTPAPYIGLMGSHRRWQTTRGLLLDSGVSESDLDRICSPIGVEIHAETPAEIAVSILAEVIDSERQGLLDGDG